MSCCFPDAHTTTNNIYLNNVQTVKVQSSLKPKFSFRKSAASSSQRLSQSQSQLSLPTFSRSQEEEI